MAAATAARSRSATEVWLLGQPEPNPCWGKQLSKKRASATALLPLRPCAAEVGEKKRLPSSRGGGGGVGESTDPTQKKSRCVERILRLYASWQNLIGPRSGALKLTSRIAGVSHWR
ncbi:hypothetical protein GWK47_013629 [Chionoecetes opilio]|uniref:Uncharacterized protein n=1 Tax=Chionoecetes opilio TaxID=41210 RepID=A0A8J4Y082_CHIOP|nr:hypothetical protein GWK47_013629 [Chionoecetes opilio]